ncbi:MAG: hypothetical protein ACXVFK_09450 [Solirubrobacteraceae bacterium]
MAPDEDVQTTDDKDSAAKRAEEFRERQEKAKEEIKELEQQDELPTDPKDWPDGPAKYQTIDGDGEDPYGEGITAKLGPASVEHHEDGSVSIDGEKVDNPEDYTGDPIPGGPTDPKQDRLGSDEDTVLHRDDDDADKREDDED